MPVSKKDQESATGSVVRGWSAFAKKAKEEESKVFIPEFYFRQGETTAIIQFLDDDPVVFDAHNVKVGKFFKLLACQKSVQKHCQLCREGSKISMKAAFRILDYRGRYDSEKEKYDKKPTEKYYVVGSKVGGLIAAIKDKKQRNLTELVLEVTKSGRKQSVSYNIERASDDSDNFLKPIEWEIKLPPAEETYKPLSDDQLDDMDYTVKTDDE